MIISSISSSATEQPENSAEPTGGVMLPMPRFMTIMMPKWMGCIPKLCTTGRKMGAKIRTAGVMSIKVPTTSRIRLMSSRITYLLLEMRIMALPMAAGRPVKDMTKDMVEEAAIRNMITAVVSQASARMPGRSFSLMER